jgi:hypothetical protein
MIAHATAQGLEAARRNKRLAVTLWLFNLALALAAAVPGWRALVDAIGPLPAADSLAEALSFGVLADLAELRPAHQRARDAAPRSSRSGCCGAVAGAARSKSDGRRRRPFAPIRLAATSSPLPAAQGNTLACRAARPLGRAAPRTHATAPRVRSAGWRSPSSSRPSWRPAWWCCGS